MITRTGLPVVVRYLAFVLAVFCANVYADDVKVGVYYFPGWRSNLPSATSMKPWAAIKKFPERTPMLGEYDDGSVDTVDKQLEWMHDYGIDYVVFDWYWGWSKSLQEQSILAYFQAPHRKDVPFALLWANHDAAPKTKADFEQMVDYWLKNYFLHPEAFLVNGQPVVFIFDHANLADKASKFNESVASLLALAQEKARKAGLPGIYFVASTFDGPKASSFGYSAVSTYNYHGLGRVSHSYKELDEDYRKVWAYRAKADTVPYIVPMTQGWDHRPWGPSKDPAHDNSGSSPDEFEAHLLAARNFIAAHPKETGNMGVICCWNEYGEGSYIEPTQNGRFLNLEKVKKAFGAH